MQFLFGKTVILIYCWLALELDEWFPIECGCIRRKRVILLKILCSNLTSLAATVKTRATQTLFL